MMMSVLLEQIAKQIKSCKKCRLYRTRNKAVPGEGPEGAQIAFVGEAPGYNEDQQGRPFVGRAGELLEELLDLVGMKRDQVWIGNVIKCRPPDNRGPHVDELRNCAPYLDLQLREIKPKLVCTLGRYALDHFLPGVRISEEHGKPKKVGIFNILPLYHPAAALRSARVKRDLVKDFKLIPKILSGEIEVENINNNGDDSQMSLL